MGISKYEKTQSMNMRKRKSEKNVIAQTSETEQRCRGISEQWRDMIV
jgi:hypothetical protein